MVQPPWCQLWLMRKIRCRYFLFVCDWWESSQLDILQVSPLSISISLSLSLSLSCITTPLSDETSISIHCSSLPHFQSDVWISSLIDETNRFGGGYCLRFQSLTKSSIKSNVFLLSPPRGVPWKRLKTAKKSTKAARLLNISHIGKLED